MCIKCCVAMDMMPQKIVPRLCCYCGGAVILIVSLFTKLQRMCFSLNFETRFSSRSDKWLLISCKGKANKVVASTRADFVIQ